MAPELDPVPLISGADALGLPGRVNPLFLEGTQLPIATPIAKELNLHDGQVVQANLRLSGGQAELIPKSPIIQVPRLSLGHLGPPGGEKMGPNAPR